MIELPPDRIARVRAFLGEEDTDRSRFERIHRTLTQSFKVADAQVDAARYIGAIAYLLTGQPQDFDRLSVDDGLRVAERMFFAGNAQWATSALLLKHARDVLTAASASVGRSTYYDAVHLTLLGGEMLFRRIVESLLLPYSDPPEERTMSYAEATFHDLHYWLRGDFVAEALAGGARHWPEWKSTVMRNRVTEVS